MGDHEHTLDACRMMNHRRSEASHHYRVDYEHMLQSCRMINDSDSEDEDLALIYHISKKEVYKSLWRTIDAINACPELAIQFPIDDVGQTKSSLTSYLFIHLVFSHP